MSMKEQPKNLDILKSGYCAHKIDMEHDEKKAVWSTDERWRDYVRTKVLSLVSGDGDINTDCIIDECNSVYAFRSAEDVLKWEHEAVDNMFSDPNKAAVNGEYMHLRKGVRVGDEWWTLVANITVNPAKLPNEFAFVKGEGIKVFNRGESFLIKDPYTFVAFKDPVSEYDYFGWFQPGANLLMISDIHENIELISGAAQVADEMGRPVKKIRLKTISQMHKERQGVAS